MIRSFTRLVLALVLTLGLSAARASAQAGAPGAPSPTPTPTSISGSTEERIQRLEKLLADTRAEIAALKAASGSSTDARLAEIERRIDILAQELEAMKIGEAAHGAAESPEAPAQTAAASSESPLKPPTGTAQDAGRRFGLGLSAAKVYNRESGVSIGGYGEVIYQNFAGHDQAGAPAGEEDQITLARAVVYLGYKFDRHFVLNTEIEYENAVVASDKGGEAEIEFGYIDYMNRPEFNARAGLVLVPMGLVNEQHEPTAFLGVRRPDVEDLIIPSTWRELGFGLYGEAGPFSYRGYMVNGLNAAGYSADEGIREGRQEGSEALAKSWAFTGRVDYVGMPGLTLGASVFAGNSGQGHLTPAGQEIGGFTTVVDAHADWRWRGLWLRGLYAHSTVDEAELINQLNGFEGDQSIGSQQQGWYGQLAFDVLSLTSSKMALWPFVRYEGWDTQLRVPAGYERNPENNAHQLTLGLAYYPISRLVVKADWQQRLNAARTGVNQFNVGLGYIF
jgi:TolA-binding protein